MTQSSPTLPAPFAALSPFADIWAAPTVIARAALRNTSTPEARTAFFEAASPLLDDALSYLDGKPVGALDPADQRLMDLMLALAHVGIAVEIQGDSDPRLAPWRDRMVISPPHTA